MDEEKYLIPGTVHISERTHRWTCGAVLEGVGVTCARRKNHELPHASVQDAGMDEYVWGYEDD